MLTFALAGAAPRLAAQASLPDVSVTRTSAAIVETMPGTNFTASYRIRNSGANAVKLLAALNAPPGWMLVLGSEPFTIAAGSTDLSLVSVAVPARASAGRYPIALKFERDGPGGRSISVDSIVVEIEEHRAVDLKLVSRPSYVIAGNSYALSLALSNRGNSPAAFRISAAASSGTPTRYEKGDIILDAGASKLVAVNVDTRKDADRAIEDILEIRASNVADTSIHADISTTVTIVLPAGSEIPRTPVPSRITVRSFPRNSGVSPYEIAGGGRLREGSPEKLEFLFRGSPGAFSSFGDRDEYRVQLSSTHYSVRTGDQLFSLSQLLSGGQMGFGGGLDVAGDRFAAGAYSTRFRFQPGKLSETGGYAGGHFGAGSVTSQFALNAVTRPNGPFAGNLIGSTARINPGENAHIDLEVARSVSSGMSGSALSARIVGTAPFHYDFGHIGANALFAGPPRGTSQSYASLSGNPVGDLELTASANSGSHSFRRDSIFSSERSLNTNLAAAWRGLTLEHVTTARTERNQGEASSFSERGFILRTSANTSIFSVWSALERGTGRDSTGGGKNYGEYSGGGTLATQWLRLSAYSDYYNGKSINRGPVALLNFGGDLAAVLPFGMTLTVNAFRTAPRDSIAVPTLQLDSRLVKTLDNGASLGFRIRHTTRLSPSGPAANIGYLEYSLPFGLRLARANAGGRAVGRIVDRESGRGIANTLVRVGPQAALTDRSGAVYFNGLPTGEYRASIAQDVAAASTVVVGNPNVKIDSTGEGRVRTFRLAVDLPGAIHARVRQMALAKTGVGEAPDSLIDAGPVEGVTVAFVDGADTVYRITDEKGEVSAAELPPGTWTVAVADDAPPMQRYSPAQQSVTVSRGAAASVSFSLVPTRRRIKIIEDEKVPLTPPPRKR